MVPSSFPTGTVSSDRGGEETFPRERSPSQESRIAQLEHENAVLRAALEKREEERQELIDQYERLLEQTENRGSVTATQTDGPDRFRDRVVDVLVERI